MRPGRPEVKRSCLRCSYLYRVHSNESLHRANSRYFPRPLATVVRLHSSRADQVRMLREILNGVADLKEHYVIRGWIPIPNGGHSTRRAPDLYFPALRLVVEIDEHAHVAYAVNYKANREFDLRLACSADVQFLYY